MSEGAPPRPASPRDPIRVLFSDAMLLAVDKPAGMAMHPGTGHESGTLIEWAATLLGNPRWGPAPVHRLDIETSGVAVLAVRPDAAEAVGRQFEAGEVAKAYVTLVKGHTHERGTIQLPLIRRRADVRWGPRKDRRDAVTRYRTLARARGVSVVLAEPETGITHQIRRHFAHIGHPVAGDARWGDRRFNTWLRAEHGLGRMFLHSAWLRFRHPATSRPLLLRAPLPASLSGVLVSLGVPDLPAGPLAGPADRPGADGASDGPQPPPGLKEPPP